MTELFRNGKITRKASNSTQLEVPLMGETPVQTRALANSRPSGGFFIAGKQVANGRTRKQQRICRERGWQRLDWSCLDWNEPSLRFYQGIGADRMDEWVHHRLTGASLYALAAEAGARGEGGAAR